MLRILREALAGFRRTPLLTGLSAAMIALSLLVVGLFGVAAFNIRRVIERVESRVEVVAYLRDTADPEAVAAAREEIGRLPEVSEVLYVSRDQALALARAELDDFGAVFADLDVNPLPASFDIRLAEGHRNPESVERLAAAVGAYPFVEDVRYGREWLEKVFVLRRVAAAATLILGGTFAAVAALIIGAAVRIAMFARRREISVMRLVGATDGFIRRPFLLEGLLTGLLGALLALAGTFIVYRVMSDAIVRLEWPPAAWVVGGVAAGALLGMAASAAAVRRHLREI